MKQWWVVRSAKGFLYESMGAGYLWHPEVGVAKFMDDLADAVALAFEHGGRPVRVVPTLTRWVPVEGDA